MKHGKLLIAALLLAAQAAQAQQTGEVGTQKGYELGLTYREGDPYLFCTEGQGWKKNPTQCWVPIPPYNGGTSWMYTGICRPPNYYGKQWTDDDTRSLAEYQTICSQREVSSEYGGYDGENSDYYDRQPVDR